MGLLTCTTTRPGFREHAGHRLCMVVSGKVELQLHRKDWLQMDAHTKVKRRYLLNGRQALILSLLQYHLKMTNNNKKSAKL